jgi:hypothetical protein
MMASKQYSRDYYLANRKTFGEYAKKYAKANPKKIKEKRQREVSKRKRIAKMLSDAILHSGLLEKFCLHCGNLFIRKQNSQTCCSQKCSQAEVNSRTKIEKLRIRILLRMREQ